MSAGTTTELFGGAYGPMTRVWVTTAQPDTWRKGLPLTADGLPIVGRGMDVFVPARGGGEEPYTPAFSFDTMSEATVRAIRDACDFFLTGARAPR